MSTETKIMTEEEVLKMMWDMCRNQKELRSTYDEQQRNKKLLKNRSEKSKASTAKSNEKRRIEKALHNQPACI